MALSKDSTMHGRSYYHHGSSLRIFFLTVLALGLICGSCLPALGAPSKSRHDGQVLYFSPSKSHAVEDSNPDQSIVYKVSSETSNLNDPQALRSTLTCELCKAGAVAVQFLVTKNATQEDIVAAVVDICVKFNIETERVCTGLARSFAPEVLTVLHDLVLSPKEICGLILGPDCGTFYNPLNDWNVTFPDVPQPKPKPPAPPKPGSPKIRILHLSDTHYDSQYKPGYNANCGEPLCCRVTDGVPANSSDGAGKFGDYRNCDTPLWTLENMLQHLSDQRHEFDYIYWTGDLPAHNVWNQTKESQIASLKHMFSLVLKYFPNKSVYPSLGNHESAPVNSFPPPYVKSEYSISWLYNELYDLWQNWLPRSSLDTVKRGGYYTATPYEKLRIISLNMNYCNDQNWWMLLNTTDPTGQLAWLIQTLQFSEDHGQKVHILGHIPPGDQGCLKAWSWNYYKIVNRYQNIIAGQFFGHTHHDSFQVFYDLETLTHAVGVAYTAPSVTPYPDMNMGYRIYTADGEYNTSSFQVLDHETHILNLTRANLEGNLTWELEYSAKALYNMTSLYPSDWDKLIQVMRHNQTVLETYNRLYYKSVHSGACDAKCRQTRLCEARSARSHDPDLCKDLGITDHEQLTRLFTAEGKRKAC